MGKIIHVLTDGDYINYPKLKFFLVLVIILG